MKFKKILVCVHIYYHNQVDYIIEKLRNIKKYDYDLYVTYSQENQETKEKFLNFNKDTKFLLTQNIGYDIYPFLFLIDKIDLDKYYCLLKLHTKNCNKFGSYSWRDDLYENLLDTENIFRNNFNKLKKYGMVGSKKWIFKMGDKLPEDSWLYEKICTEIGIEPIRANFVGGTIFLARIEIIKKIKNLNLLKLDYSCKKMETGSNSTAAHVVERLFGVICKQMNMRIYGSDQLKMFSEKWNKRFIKNVFSLENKYTYKYLTFLWISIRFKRYKYNINGDGNKLYIINGKNAYPLRKKSIKGLNVSIKGENNFIGIANNAKFENCNFKINADNGVILVKDNTELKNCEFTLEKEPYMQIEITENTKLENKEIISNDKYEQTII